MRREKMWVLELGLFGGVEGGFLRREKEGRRGVMLLLLTLLIVAGDYRVVLPVKVRELMKY